MIFQTNAPFMPETGDIKVKHRTNGKGKHPIILCSRSSSILSQMKGKIAVTNNILQENLSCINAVINHLTNILFLNPIPSDMRDYVRSTEIDLRQNGENISAVLKKMCGIPEKKNLLMDIIRSLPENEIKDISFIETTIGDVMLALEESFGNTVKQVDAKRLSDGTLRCLAIAAAIITEKEGSTVIIEEIDNGIHPSRAKGLISKISEISRKRNIDIIMTTHNSTVLNSLSKENLKGVAVAFRDKENGSSCITAFLDIPNYVNLLTQGGLGSGAENDILTDSVKKVNLSEANYDLS